MSTTRNTKAKGAKERREIGWKNEFTKLFVWELDHSRWLQTIWKSELNEICNKHKQFSTRVEIFKKFLINLAKFFKPEYSFENEFYCLLLNEAINEIDYLEIAEAYVADFEAHENAIKDDTWCSATKAEWKELYESANRE